MAELNSPGDSARDGRLRILTNVEEPRCRCCWQECVDFRPECLSRGGRLGPLRAAWNLLRLCHQYDAVIVDSDRTGGLFTLLAALLPFRVPPIVVIDCLWVKPSGRLRLMLKRLQLWLSRRVVVKFVVWASHEVERYAETFRIPTHLLQYIPHHHTLEGYHYVVTEGDYVFAGGDGHRDYRTLLDAVRGLLVPVRIATRRNDWCEPDTLSTNVEVQPATPVGFRELMAGARLVVVPLEAGHIHVGGEQTYLNAMAMGKPVIVTDELGAPDYIQHGVNGLVVPAGDAGALRAAIESVLSNSEFAADLSRNASRTYDDFSTPRCLEGILALVESLVAGRAPAAAGAPGKSLDS